MGFKGLPRWNCGVEVQGVTLDCLFAGKVGTRIMNSRIGGKSGFGFLVITGSTRIRHLIDHMCLYIDAEEHESGDLGEPTNYKAALLDQESDKWMNAMNVKWLFKKKTNMDGVVHIYKAHLMAKSYTQTLGIDYEENFSPVAAIRAIRILIVIAAYYDYKIWQINVKTVFLNGYLS
nr:hypothetical protein [Tanacetum cinerariifolium]